MTHNHRMNESLNEIWEQLIKSKGADFVYFVNTSVLPMDATEGYSGVVLLGKPYRKNI